MSFSLFFLFFRLDFAKKKSKKIETHQHVVQRLCIEKDLSELRRTVAEPNAEGVGVDLMFFFCVCVLEKETKVKKRG